ncbi:hypothetical protein ANTQUA_LOCUS872 [Anthophora quadrimaculata]
MNIKSILENALLFLLLYLASSFLQIITEVDVPELQLLASNLKPEECVKLVSLDSHSPLSDAQIEKLAREQSCFRRLVKWICELRTVTRNTYPILNDLLERIGRRDLIACLVEFSMKTSKSPKVIRDVQAAEDSEDYEGVAVTTTPKPKEDTKQEVKPKKDDKDGTLFSNQTIEAITGNKYPINFMIIPTQSTKYAFRTFTGYTINVSLKTAGIVLVSTILLSCCCTLLIRRRITNLFNKLRRKKKKGKFIAIDDDRDVARSYLIRKPRIKRKRAPSYELVHTATQSNTVLVPQEPEEPPPTGCSKCYKKKRKKNTRRPHR